MAKRCAPGQVPLHRLGRNGDILQNQWSFAPLSVSKSWPRSEMVAISGLYPLHFWGAQPARSATQYQLRGVVTRRGGFQGHGAMGLGRGRTRWHGEGLQVKLPSCYTDRFCPCFRGRPQPPVVLLPPTPGCWGGEGRSIPPGVLHPSHPGGHKGTRHCGGELCGHRHFP